MQGFEAVSHGFCALKMGQGRVDLHELKGDGFAGITDLLNGFGACHKVGMEG